MCGEISETYDWGSIGSVLDTLEIGYECAYNE